MRQNPEGYAATCEALAKATAADPRLHLRADAARHRRRRHRQSAERRPGALADRIAGATPVASSTAAAIGSPIEKPDECNQRIAEFLKRVEQ